MSAAYLIFSVNKEVSIPISIDPVPYVLAEEEPSSLPARRWMALALGISKKESLSPPSAARLYAYVSSIYSDTRKETDSSNEASIATGELIATFYPNYEDRIKETLSSMQINDPRLSQKGMIILREYLDRSRNDGLDLIWDEKLPLEKSWYHRPGQKDAAAASGKWLTWNIKSEKVIIPSPPQKGLSYSLDLLEMGQMVNKRSVEEEETIFFWTGRDNFYDPNTKLLPLPGIWQNILFAETGNGQTDMTYAENQKILAQTLADALIISWRAKYDYFAARPSMVIDKFRPLLTDPPSPGYVSEYAATGSAAADILSVLFPDKETVFRKLSFSSAQSRVLAGVEFPSAVRSGQVAGSQVAWSTLAKFFPDLFYSKSEDHYNDLIPQLKSVTKLLINRFLTSLSNVPEVISSIYSPPAFTDVAKIAGLDEQTELGALWGDVNNDGFLDLMTARGLYRNNGQGKFKLLQETQGLRAPGAFGDYNNDGCSDFYAVKTGHERSPESKGETDQLFRGNCDGSFKNVTAGSGVADDSHGTSAAWADFNNDGLLDVYVTNFGSFPGQEFSVNNPVYRHEPNILYQNNGDGTFTNVTKEAGVVGLLDCPVYRESPHGLALKVKVSFQPIWFDYNNDRFMDLLVISDTFMSPLYKNNGNGTFTEVTAQAGLCGPERDSNMGVAVGDYNNDGYLDIFVNDNGDDYLWQNKGNGTFKNIVKEAGVNEPGYGWGTEALDYDNDGLLDILVVNGHNRIPAKSYFIPNLKNNDQNELFKNNGNGKFSAVGLKEGLRGNDINFSAAVADYNNDGFPDIFIPTWGERHSSSGSALYKNRGNSNHWLTVHLVGSTSNRDGVGARLVLKAGGKHQTREVVSGSSYVSQSTPWPTFGLGRYQTAESLEIIWPSGLTQTFKDIKTNQKIIIREGSDKIFSNLKDLPEGKKH